MRLKRLEVVCTFLCTSSPDINIERVLQRAQAGGYAASETEIRAVHLAALANLGEAVRVFDRCRILDTSEPCRRPRFVARAAGGKCTLEPAAPSWVARALQIDLGRG